MSDLYYLRRKKGFYIHPHCRQRCKRRKVSHAWRSHLASGTWSLSCEQGSKLLARQFRDDCLYVCDWPGCVHKEEKRKYWVFRGVFKNFKRTRAWGTIHDGNKRKLDFPCAICACKFTWDLHSAFCLRRGFGFHGDGEPVIQAYVCQNGHVSSAWTDVPMYT
ncbi:phytochrome A-associated F-box protein-like [Cajanus cajan]|uniref:phytochrome A-associated F-box protein-like n=1 Tax=Cajanus cajan TaxID=3821 RepID=UPI00098DAC7E|nr:phytochrome A-associated F-box protein-like [Cajanus cajan]